MPPTYLYNVDDLIDFAAALDYPSDQLYYVVPCDQFHELYVERPRHHEHDGFFSRAHDHDGAAILHYHDQLGPVHYHVSTIEHHQRPAEVDADSASNSPANVYTVDYNADGRVPPLGH